MATSDITIIEVNSTSTGTTLATATVTAAAASLERITAALVGNVAESSARLYRADALQFHTWLTHERGLTIESASFEDVTAYRQHLARQYSHKATAGRKLVVARRLLNVAVILKLRTDNPAEGVKGFKGATGQETTHRALTKSEARLLLTAVDQTSQKGKRDYALISLLIRTGLRRAEAASLTLGDLKLEQGHHTAIVQHGKGDKRRVVKLPVDVMRSISDYLEATGRKEAGPDAPLFVAWRGGKGDQPGDQALSGLDIERVIKKYAAQADLEGLTPHGLRASFVTLALEGGAKLEQVQYAAGHADPRTTERYQKRKLNLDDNASDYVKL